MSFTAAQLMELVGMWFWPFVRIAALLTVAPIFGTRSVPVRVRMGLALTLTLVIAPVVSTHLPDIELFSAQGVLVTAQQVLIGLSIGFAMRLLFTVLQVAGQLVAQLMGLGFAAMVDPQSGVQVPVVSQLYVIVATLAFLSLDGHLLLIRALADSFQVLQVASYGVGQDALWSLATQAGWVFSSALLIALPSMAALLVVNLAFGVMTRAAPQLNVFAVGFPVVLILGFVIMFITLPSLVFQLGDLFDAAFELAGRVIGGAR
jgi:flagellar biosynthetic protein FliR